MVRIPGLLTILLVITTGIRGQRIDSAIAEFNNVVRFEKAYVHFDNTRYAVGQTIWYKAYLMTGLQPSLISKNFYIDWYDDEGRLLNSTVTPVVYSFSSGSFTIPETYTGKFVRAVAYTRWMRNFDRAYFYEQAFEIISAASRIENNDPAGRETRAQFLPESGTFLANKLNVIAFKAIDHSGRPAAISGVVKNSNGDSILSFKSSHDGMGKFQFKAAGGESYSVLWTDPSGHTYQSNLPIPEASAVSLLLEPGRSNRIFHIQRTGEAPDRMKQLTLVGQMNGILLFQAKVDLSEKESVTGSLPVGKMATGVLQLTVFDADLRPLCERIVFVRNEDYLLKATLQVDSLNTNKRGRNVLEIHLNDTTYANLSISVTDAHLDHFPQDNILTQLLLKGDLPGNVYRPGYYFSSNADSVLDHLDLVMLTNGWRRYNWDEILHHPLPVLKYARDSGYASIDGKIANFTLKTNRKAASINLIFVAKDSSNSMISLPIREDGSFSSRNVMLFDTTRVYFQLHGLKNIAPKDVFIENDLFKTDATIDSPRSSSEFDTTGRNPFQALVERQTRSAHKYQTLKEVTVRSKQASRLKELDLKYAKGIFTGDATAAFDMSSLENASHRSSIFDFLSGKVPGLEVGGTNGGTATEGVVEYRRGTPVFYLDERVISTSELVNINLDNVAYIKVFSPPFAGGLNGSTGEIASGAAIAIYTKQGQNGEPGRMDFKSNGMEYKLIAGYAPSKQFYEPAYPEKWEPGDPEDLRSTLLWNPWITLDKKNQTVKIVFYNNDAASSFRVIIEGMDGTGRLVHIGKLLK